MCATELSDGARGYCMCDVRLCRCGTYHNLCHSLVPRQASYAFKIRESFVCMGVTAALMNQINVCMNARVFCHNVISR